MADRYPQVMRFVSETAWAIRPSKLAVIQELLELRASGERLTAEQIEARIGAGPAVKQRQEQTGSVAVIPIYGVLTPRADLFSQMSGATSMQGFMDSLRAAAADDSIGAILLDIDSPGGSVDLVSEAAAEIRAARGSKPIVAIANTMAASAAYWLGSQADEFVVTPSGIVGSIGVFSIHQDFSAKLAEDGVSTTLIKAGKFKAEGNPYEPLSEEALAAIQAHIDTFYEMFKGDVAAGRGVSVQAVQDGFGQGRIVTAADARAEGMVDEIATFEATVERMIVQAATGSSGRQARASAGLGVTIASMIAQTSAAMTTWTTGDPPGSPGQQSTTIDNTEAATSGLLFAQAAIAVRDAADKLTADARALRALTGAKRDVLSAVAESLTGSAAALAELLANQDADPLTDERVADAFDALHRSVA